MFRFVLDGTCSAKCRGSKPASDLVGNLVKSGISPILFLGKQTLLNWLLLLQIGNTHTKKSDSQRTSGQLRGEKL